MNTGTPVARAHMSRQDYGGRSERFDHSITVEMRVVTGEKGDRSVYGCNRAYGSGRRAGGARPAVDVRQDPARRHSGAPRIAPRR